MLDDFSHEMDNTDTKMDSVMKKMAKVLHMSNGTTIQTLQRFSFNDSNRMNIQNWETIVVQLMLEL